MCVFDVVAPLLLADLASFSSYYCIVKLSNSRLSDNPIVAEARDLLPHNINLHQTINSSDTNLLDNESSGLHFRAASCTPPTQWFECSAGFIHHLITTCWCWCRSIIGSIRVSCHSSIGTITIVTISL